MEKTQSLITMIFFFYCLLVLQVINFYLLTSFSFSFNCFNWNGNNFANKLLILDIRLPMVPDLKVQTQAHVLTAQVCDMKYASRSRAMSHTFSLQAKRAAEGKLPCVRHLRLLQSLYSHSQGKPEPMVTGILCLVCLPRQLISQQTLPLPTAQ